MANHKTIKERVSALEVYMKDTREDITNGFKEMKENDLRGIKDRLTIIEENINSRPTWVITALCSLAVGLIIFVVTSYR